MENDIEKWLKEGEETPDWDSQKLRACVAQLNTPPVMAMMVREQLERLTAIEKRFTDIKHHLNPSV